MQWPTIEEISAMTPLPEGYRYENMRRADVVPLIEAIREWFPSVSVGVASCYLTEQFYLDKVVIDDETDKDVIALLIKRGDELVGMGSWERESAAMTLYARLGVIAPAHPGAKLAVLAMELGEKMGRAMGAGFIHTLATMKMPQMQLALERSGYQFIGFMPGYDREEVSPGVVKRVFEAGYCKATGACGTVFEAGRQEYDAKCETPLRYHLSSRVVIARVASLQKRGVCAA